MSFFGKWRPLMAGLLLASLYALFAVDIINLTLAAVVGQFSCSRAHTTTCASSIGKRTCICALELGGLSSAAARRPAHMRTKGLVMIRLRNAIVTYAPSHAHMCAQAHSCFWRCSPDWKRRPQWAPSHCLSTPALSVSCLG